MERETEWEKEWEKDTLMRFAKFSRLLQQYHQVVHMNNGPFGDPRRGQGRILAILAMKPEITQKELSYLLDMRPQSLGELLSKLEKKELITRQPSVQDRRVMEIRLTQLGQETLRQQKSEKKAEAFDLLGVLNEEERQQLGASIDKLIAALEAKLNEYGDFRGGPGAHGPRRSHEHPEYHQHPAHHGHGDRRGPGIGFGDLGFGQPHPLAFDRCVDEAEAKDESDGDCAPPQGTEESQ